MTPAEVEALLALPEDVRAELRDGRGPGWACFPGPVAVPQMRPQPTYEAWLPADTGEILTAVAVIVSDYASVRMHGDFWYARCGTDEAEGETARLAALRLLSALRRGGA